MSVSISSMLTRIMAECILYGAYVVVFGIAMWILPRKIGIPSVKRFIFPAAILLFALATINIAYDLTVERYTIVHGSLTEKKTWINVGRCVDISTYILADILGDSVLFFRVYAVWGFRKRVLLPTLLLLVLTKVLGILAAITQVYLLVRGKERYTGFFSTIFGVLLPVFPIMNVVSNVFMTTTIVLRGMKMVQAYIGIRLGLVGIRGNVIGG
ncbi:hypothetical protein BT96DRAFT_971130 [Gymnopus androsaceus JB14]|uniref:Uncharacterized protein n=1 Tax=Gymnopus androsaceus JB14 TaxID=1447944 RepID=A0A6A4IAQ4_9AGAR|nr:hypothetical protein BT96DRAFT_971130 [Gymnopus androsaceus JB14]